MTLATAALLSGCGGVHMPAPTVTGIAVHPSATVAYSEDLPPKNQVSFAAYQTFSDGSIGANPISNAQWTYDFAPWVSLTKRGYMYPARPSGDIYLDVYDHRNRAGKGE